MEKSNNNDNNNNVYVYYSSSSLAVRADHPTISQVAAMPKNRPGIRNYVKVLMSKAVL